MQKRKMNCKEKLLARIIIIALLFILWENEWMNRSRILCHRDNPDFYPELYPEKNQEKKRPNNGNSWWVGKLIQLAHWLRHFYTFQLQKIHFSLFSLWFSLSNHFHCEFPWIFLLFSWILDQFTSSNITINYHCSRTMNDDEWLCLHK